MAVQIRLGPFRSSCLRLPAINKRKLSVVRFGLSENRRYSLVVERELRKLKVAGSIPVVGFVCALVTTTLHQAF